MRPDALVGTVRPLDTGVGKTRVLGFINRGGTFTIDGMMYANKCSWIHAIAAVAEIHGIALNRLLSDQEIDIALGRAAP
jgi:hypothetical protein